MLTISAPPARRRRHRHRAVPERPVARLLQDRPFRRYFAAVAMSLVGTQIAFLAVPLVAVLALDATAGEVGLLGFTGTVAFLLFGLPVGAWLDRVRKRKVMIAADLLRGILMMSVPLAWWFDALSLPLLLVMVFFNGICTVFFDVGSQSYLPGLVGRDRLVPANALISGWDASVSIAGPSVAALLVRLLTAPFALVVNAVAYLASAVGLMLVHRPEPAPPSFATRPLMREIRDGAGFVITHRTLAAIALAGAGTNLFIKMGIVVMPLVFVGSLGLGEAALGLFFTAGGLGVFLGSASARPLADRFGFGRCLWIVNLALAPFGLLVPFLDHGAGMVLGVLGWFSCTFRVGVSNVLTVSIRQHVTPDHLLSRMNATMRVFITGSLTVGAALAGLVGEIWGLRVVLWVVAVGLSVAWLPLYFSPLRTARAMPESITA